MALVRILVDGYSLLHAWPELAPGKPRFSEAAREELVAILRLYMDAEGTPVTVIFDGRGTGRGHGRVRRKPVQRAQEIEVIYSNAGQTADQLIERAAHRFQPYGEVLAVTDDLAERETVLSLGGMASSCWNFMQTVENALAEVSDHIKHHNRQERHQFQRRKI